MKKYQKIKAHTRQHIKVNFRLHILKRIYTAASSSGHLLPLHRTDHYMKHKSLVGAFIVRCPSHRSSLTRSRQESCCVCSSKVRVLTISIKLCHDHYVRSCELSEPHAKLPIITIIVSKVPQHRLVSEMKAIGAAERNGAGKFKAVHFRAQD